MVIQNTYVWDIKFTNTFVWVYRKFRISFMAILCKLIDERVELICTTLLVRVCGLTRNM